jgi:hypothetical protein
VSHKHAYLLEDIFKEPVSANIHWRDVESLLHHLGATVQTTHGARLHVVLNGVEGRVHRPHHGGACDKHDIRHLRQFLAAARVTPSSYQGYFCPSPRKGKNSEH